MAEHITLGKRGEDIAVEYLKRKGYTILWRNWRCYHKEIDIVAKDHDFLVIVEVKTRRNDFYGSPIEAVSEQKQKLLVVAANAYVEQYDVDNEIRFDIISIILPKYGEPTIEHIEDAFWV